MQPNNLSKMNYNFISKYDMSSWGPHVTGSGHADG
jgi:hypothetical protein